MDKVKEYIEKNKNKFLDELFELLRIPSISAKSEHKKDVLSCAKLLKDHLELNDFENCEICKTNGHPIVYGEKIVDHELPTVLVYGHYDVQPIDPVELWDSSPFEPQIKKTQIHPEGAIFARGACDDKGQMFMHIKAFEILNKNGGFPCNIKIMIEGEEEIGSDNLEIFIEKNQKKLECDVILVSDTGMIDKKTPSITIGLRGMTYMELELIGPNRDLHSGHYGGSVINPINELSRIINHLHDNQNKVTIPGFYDDVVEYSKPEREKMESIPFSEVDYAKSVGLNNPTGEDGYSSIERRSIRPCLDVNGIWGGYTEEGSKTVIPSKAFAKISMRLVPNQKWRKISKQFSDYINKIASPNVTVKVTEHHGGEPYLTSTESKAYKSASAAYKDVFKKEPIPTRDGGSIPIIAQFEKILRSKTILMGFGLDSDAIHSPNEHFGVSNFLNGIETITKFYHHYTK